MIARLFLMSVLAIWSSEHASAQLIDASLCPAGPAINIDPQLIMLLKLNGNLEDSSQLQTQYAFSSLYYIQSQQSFVQVNQDEPLAATMEFNAIQSSDQFMPSIPITASYSKSIFLNVIDPSVSFFNTYGSASLIGGMGNGPNEYHQLVIMDDGVYAWHGQRNTPFRLQAMSQLGNDRSIVPIGGWQHLGLTFDAPTQTFSWYLNGTFVASEQSRFTSTWQGSAANQLQIGDTGVMSDPSYRPLHGTAIKYARMYNGKLTDDQMMSVFTTDLQEFAATVAANQILDAAAATNPLTSTSVPGASNQSIESAVTQDSSTGYIIESQSQTGASTGQ